VSDEKGERKIERELRKARERYRNKRGEKKIM
jgi:hypothetical protein